MNVVEEVKAAKRVSTPLLAVSTMNQPDTATTLAGAMPEEVPVVTWSHATGLKPGNDKGAGALAGLGDLEASRDPATMLEMLQGLPEKSTVLMFNGHNYVVSMERFGNPVVSAGVCNLREQFKTTNRTLILLGPSFELPPELQGDVVMLRDPLPDDEKLGMMVDEMVKETEAELPEEQRGQVVSALRGLSSFGAEQQAYMSLGLKDENGKRPLNTQSLWDRKVQAVNNVAGLEMRVQVLERDGIRGLDGVMKLFDGLFAGPEPPGCVLHIDEIDKYMGGAGAAGGPGDSSGVTQDILGQLLQRMEDSGWDGMMPVGPPGTGKTLVSKSVAGIYKIPYLRLDIGGVKGSLVGESERKIRLALEMVERIGNGKVFVMATCNRLESIPPELRRRMTFGLHFFDLPEVEDRAEIWKLYCAKFGVKLPETVGKWDAGWTGAEIRNAVKTAWRMGCSVQEAARFIVPVAQSAAAEIERLREMANGKFLDAAKGGVYIMRKGVQQATGGGRKVVD